MTKQCHLNLNIFWYVSLLGLAVLLVDVVVYKEVAFSLRAIWFTSMSSNYTSGKGHSTSPRTFTVFRPNSTSSSPMSSTPLSTSAPSSALSSGGSETATSRESSNSSPPWYPRLLCKAFTGRLGNQLFEYASTLGLALTMHRTPVFLNNGILANVLKTFPSATTPSQQERCRTAPSAIEGSCCKFYDRLVHLDPKRDYRIGIYLQSYKYFLQHEHEIRKAVTFSDAIREKSALVVRRLRQRYNSSTLVGVHVRRGDLALKRNVQLGYPLTPVGYINKSLAFFQALHPGCVFVVASDSLQWCRQNFPSGYRVQFLEEGPPAVHMDILAATDHAVLSFGSYSWWVGFLNAGTKVYMKDFILADTFIGKAFNPGGRDYVYPGWIPL